MGEKLLYYWFEVVSTQGFYKFSFKELKEFTTICKKISRLVGNYISRECWFFQSPRCYERRRDCIGEMRYNWYSPYNLRNVSNLSNIPITTKKIEFLPSFNSILTTIPSQITHIVFGFAFNQKIGFGLKSNIRNLPSSLTHLEFSNHHLTSHDMYRFSPSQFNQPINDLPPNLKSLILSDHFNQVVKNLPSKMTHLKFGESFNREVNDLPPSLTHLTFGSKFNLPVNNLPSSITTLVFGSDFNQRVDNLPPFLRYLRFGIYFNQRVNNLPQHITQLVFGYFFNQPVNNLPPNITHLTFGPKFNRPFEEIEKFFDNKLQCLFVSYWLLMEYQTWLPLNFSTSKIEDKLCVSCWCIKKEG